MAAVRRGAGAFLRYFTPLLFLAAVVQIFLAGYGVFGIEEGDGLEEAGSLDAHREFGFILGQIGGLLLFIAALIWWPANKRLLGLYVLVAFLMAVVQIVLAGGGEWVGAFHPLNGILILGLLGYLSNRMWRGRADLTEERLETPR